MFKNNRILLGFLLLCFTITMITFIVRVGNMLTKDSELDLFAPGVRVAQDYVSVVTPPPGAVYSTFCTSPMGGQKYTMPFVPPLTFEVIMFLIALYHAVSTFQAESASSSFHYTGMTALHIMWRDSVIYFFV